MASSLIITVKSDRADIGLVAKAASVPHVGLVELSQFFKKCSMGSESASVDVQYNASAAPVAASATVTCATVAADDTVTIAGVVLTAKASPANENQFSQAGTDNADAVSLAAKINAHSVLSKIVSASAHATTGVVTITCLTKGIIGNYLTLVSSSGSTLAVTGSGFLAGGTGGINAAAVTYPAGL